MCPWERSWEWHRSGERFGFSDIAEAHHTHFFRLRLFAVVGTSKLEADLKGQVSPTVLVQEKHSAHSRPLQAGLQGQPFRGHSESSSLCVVQHLYPALLHSLAQVRGAAQEINSSFIGILAVVKKDLFILGKCKGQSHVVLSSCPKLNVWILSSSKHVFYVCIYIQNAFKHPVKKCKHL